MYISPSDFSLLVCTERFKTEEKTFKRMPGKDDRLTVACAKDKDKII